jgi:hypothetical protein
MFRIAFSLLVLLTLITPSLWAQKPLSLEDRSALNELRFKAAQTALTLERLRPAIRQIQEAQAAADAALHNLQSLEQSLSKRYTDGEKVLNPDLEWVVKPSAPEPSPQAEKEP